MEESEKVLQLGHGMSVEELSALYFDEDALLEAPERVFRLNTSGNRYYYTFPDEFSAPKFFISVTTMIKQTLPTSEFLIKWIADMGYEESRNYMSERASYGTFLHIQISEFLISKTYDLDELKKKLKAYIEAENLPTSFINYADELKKDMLSFAQFCIDTNLKPLAIEVILTHPTDGYAGALDLACELDAPMKGHFGEVYKSGKKKGEPRETTKVERVRAIVDFKSGRKGFYESHKIQLKAYGNMWNERFPDFPINALFNWSPKDWRGTVPTYNLEDQTNAKELLKLPYLVELARIENSEIDRMIVSTNGVISMQGSLDENISQHTLTELVTKKKDKETTPIEEEQLPIEEIAGKKVEKGNPTKPKSKGKPITPKKETKPKKVVKKRINPKDLGI